MKRVIKIMVRLFVIGFMSGLIVLIYWLIVSVIFTQIVLIINGNQY